MAWSDPVDNYCERLDPSFWAEPLNAVSNVAFIVAGLVLLRQWRRSHVRDRIGLVLCLNVLVIGIGSFLFHTFANRWSLVADVVPIAVFIHLYLALACWRYLNWPWWLAAGAAAAFFMVSPLVGAAAAPWFGSSASYVPALAAMFAMASLCLPRNRTLAGSLTVAGLLFASSIGLRMADQPWCAVWPLGTHVAWHGVNAVVLYTLVRVYFEANARPATR